MGVWMTLHLVYLALLVMRLWLTFVLSLLTTLEVHLVQQNQVRHAFLQLCNTSLLKQGHGASDTVCMMNNDRPVWTACQTSGLTLVMAHCS